MRIPASVPEILKNDLPLGVRGCFHYINGEFVSPKSDHEVPTMDPSTGELICMLPCASSDEVDRAFRAADSVRESFGTSSVSDRVRALKELANLVEGCKSRLAVIESWDCGKALREAEADMEDVVRCIRYNAGLCEKISEWQRESRGTSGAYSLSVEHEPIGVFCLITPWNYPLLMAIQKVSASIAAGCPLVLKASEYASLTCIELAALIGKTSLPKGVFNLLVGDGSTTGDMMVQHPLSAKVSFTGSVPTGKKIMSRCAEQVRPLHLELGGKGAMLLFEDADLESAVDWVLMGIFWGAGQVCSATSRLLVHKTVYERVLEMIKLRVSKSILIGPPLQEGVTLGPVVSPEQYEKVKSFIRIGKKEGLKALIGGTDERPEHLSHSKGYFISPTAFFDVPTTSTLWKEEIFGPVLCIRSFIDEQDALKVANETPYGLGAAVMTRDPERATRVTRKLQAGSVWVNCSQPVIMDLGQPFGGFKQSGFGKECGIEGLKEYFQPKAIISVPHGHSENLYPLPKF